MSSTATYSLQHLLKSSSSDLTTDLTPCFGGFSENVRSFDRQKYLQSFERSINRRHVYTAAERDLIRTP